MLKKIVFLCLLSVCLAGFAAPAQKGFSVNLILSKSCSVADQFNGFLANRAPFVSTVQSVVCGEPFRVYVMFSGAAVKESRISVSGKIVMCSPKGRTDTVPLTGSLKINGAESGVFLLPGITEIMFEPKDPKGTYLFDLELTDLYSGQTARKSAVVKYADPLKPDSRIDAFSKVGQYYLTPCPEYVIPAFRQFLELQKKEKDPSKKNPVPGLALFYYLLKENPQLLPEFNQMVKQELKGNAKGFGELLLYYLDPEKAVFTKEQKDRIKQVFPSDPFVVQSPELPWQLDVLWAQFFVQGTKEPVMKVVNAINLVQDSMSLEAYKKLKNPAPSDRQKVMNTLVAGAARWSVSAIAKSHPQVLYYIEAALERKEISNERTASILRDAVKIKLPEK